jgi:hypothetical protein
VAIIQRRVFKNGDHPYENLAKYGYALDVEYNSLINLLYSWLHTENKT